MVGLYQVLFNHDFTKAKHASKSSPVFFIEKYYNTAASNVASYSCATQVPTETLIVV